MRQNKALRKATSGTKAAKCVFQAGAECNTRGRQDIHPASVSNAAERGASEWDFQNFIHAQPSEGYCAQKVNLQ